MYDPGVVLVVRVKDSDRDDLGVLWLDRLFDGLVSFEGGSGVDVQSAVGVHLVAQTLPAADEIVVVDRTEPELVDLVDDQVVGFLDDVLVEFVASVPFGEQRIEQGIELPVAVEHDDLLVAQRVVDVVEQGTRFSGAWQPLDEDERTGRVGQFLTVYAALEVDLPDVPVLDPAAPIHDLLAAHLSAGFGELPHLEPLVRQDLPDVLRADLPERAGSQRIVVVGQEVGDPACFVPARCPVRRGVGVRQVGDGFREVLQRTVGRPLGAGDGLLALQYETDGESRQQIGLVGMEDLQIGVVSDVCGIEYGDEQVRVVADGCQIFVLFGGVAQG